MTFRAKPVVKRSRNPWDSGDRRTFLTNVAFALVIVAALLILLVAVGYTWYDSHLAPVGSVAGQSITKDQFNERLEIEALAAQGAGAPHRQPGGERQADGCPGGAGSADPDQPGPADPGACARADHRQPRPGEPRCRGGCLGHGCRHRRQAGRGGDDPCGAPPMGHRGRAGGERRSARADDGPDCRGTRRRRTTRARTSRAAPSGRTSPRVSRPMSRLAIRAAISAGSWPRTPRSMKVSSRPRSRWSRTASPT